MEKYLLVASERHPEIRLSDGHISIKGHSIPRNPRKIYKPVQQWVKSYVKNPPPHTEVDLQINFFDSGSTKAILNILKILANCQNKNHEIEIVFNWIYLKQDDSIKELGAFFESYLNVPLNYLDKISHSGQQPFKARN